MGCWPKTETGTFQKYEYRETGEYQEISPFTGKKSDYFSNTKVPVTVSTGSAIVTLDDGSEIAATCPIQNLEQGNSVTVQQDDDETWVVTGKQ